MTEIKPKSPSGYLAKTYDDRFRFASYWYQIQEVINNIESKEKILEIGPGSRFMTDYLLKHGFSVETLDVREVTKPDYIGSVSDLPLPDSSFDVIACFQVLEHLPFELFFQSLSEIARVARKKVLFSVPDVRYFLEIDLSLISKRQRLQATLSFPRITSGKKMPHYHLWEIGRPGYPLTKILLSFPPELKLIKSYRIPGNAYHHMFICDVCAK
jgi:ubiquinone/menaquinone biosynthesis C-methylase UbiE